MSGFSIILMLASVPATALLALAQPLSDTFGGLGEPTGPFLVGRVTLLCEDASRIEPLDPNAAPRRIMVDVWYPAEPHAGQAQRAVYLNVATFRGALGAEGMRHQFGRAYDAISSDRVVTHAVSEAPFARAAKLAPLLLFSPGGGMIRELYTTQMEDLASHGYVVAAMTHSYDGFLTIFPDQSFLRSDTRRWPRVPSVEGEANLNQLEWHTDDLLAVLDHLTHISGGGSLSSPIAGHLDLKRIGAVGHSFGGVAAAHACQKDQRIKACLNQDGAMAMKPFYPDVGGWGMNQAFMLIERPPNREPLSDQDLADLKLTRARATGLVARLNSERDRILQSTGKGSYRVLLRRSVTTHMDFSDLRILSAENGIQRNKRMQVLAQVTSYTRAFFDRHVRGLKASLPDGGKPNEVIESVEIFRPAGRKD